MPQSAPRFDAIIDQDRHHFPLNEWRKNKRRFKNFYRARRPRAVRCHRLVWLLPKSLLPKPRVELVLPAVKRIASGQVVLQGFVMAQPHELSGQRVTVASRRRVNRRHRILCREERMVDSLRGERIERKGRISNPDQSIFKYGQSFRDRGIDRGDPRSYLKSPPGVGKGTRLQ
jgi:hypothetical protein